MSTAAAANRLKRAMPTATASALKVNKIQNRGARVIDVGSGGIVPNPVEITMKNTDHTKVRQVFLGKSSFLTNEIPGVLEAPDDVSFNGTIDGLMEEIGSGTYFVSGITLRCADTAQFRQKLKYVEGSNGRFYSEDISTRILQANDGSSLDGTILPAVFPSGYLLALNKNSGFVVTLKAAKDDSTPLELSLTLEFGAAEDRVMGIYL